MREELPPLLISSIDNRLSSGVISPYDSTDSPLDQPDQEIKCLRQELAEMSTSELKRAVGVRSCAGCSASFDPQMSLEVAVQLRACRIPQD